MVSQPVLGGPIDDVTSRAGIDFFINLYLAGDQALSISETVFLSLRINLTHPAPETLGFTLFSPSNLRNMTFQVGNVGCPEALEGVVIDDHQSYAVDGGTPLFCITPQYLKTSQSFQESFSFTNPNGQWKLNIRDRTTDGSSGYLHSLSLLVQGKEFEFHPLFFFLLLTSPFLLLMI